MVMLITPKECKAHERKLAGQTARKTSTFGARHEGKNGGWVVGYNYHLEGVGFMRMLAMLIMANQYATQQREDAKRSIKENRGRLVSLFWN